MENEMVSSHWGNDYVYEGSGNAGGEKGDGREEIQLTRDASGSAWIIVLVPKQQNSVCLRSTQLEQGGMELDGNR